ncbi:thiamine pyrophosphate-binding protein [Pseudomaricurvus alkylphenolicus]|uniref:thiamine pyrophosphate-dependent enzyme n=1 Tax=Pseudomaricurvus alkylphenolicus TaxID=1306991 RepID=UPI00141EEBE9|nr:thiamine pyrophosphate-binding protein [Pseudomaricurvus alkylphenolicus]
MSDKIKGGELLLRCLQQEKVKHIHAITDGTYMSMLEPLERLQEELGIRLLVPRHEAAAAHLCDGYARVSGEPAVVMACAGPGAANLISGLLCTQAEGSPLVAITTTRRSEIGDSYPQQAAMQVGDQHGTFKAAVKWSGKVDHWHRIPDMVRHAFRMATTGCPGVAHLLIPQDVLDGLGDPDAVEIQAPQAYRFSAQLKQKANDEAIQQAAKMLVDANLAMAYAGNGCVRAFAQAELSELVEYLSMPVLKTGHGMSAFPCGHELALNAGNLGGMVCRLESDVVLVIGSRLGELSAFGREPAWSDSAKTKMIQIDSEPANIGLNRPADIGLVGDAKAVLAQLIEAVKGLTAKREKHPRMDEFKGYQAQARDNLDAHIAQYQDPLCVGTVYAECNRFYGNDAIAVVDGGNTSWWSVSCHQVKEGAIAMGTPNYGHLGAGLPHAMGAKLAAPERPVYCVTGDSAFGFNIQELETAVREDLPVVILVMVDGAWGMEKTAQKRTWGREAPWFGVFNAPEIRYDKVCEAMGGHGEFVTTAAEIRPALERSIAVNRVSVIHCVIDPDSNVWPPGIEMWNALRSGNFEGLI